MSREYRAQSIIPEISIATRVSHKAKLRPKCRSLCGTATRRPEAHLVARLEPTMAPSILTHPAPRQTSRPLSTTVTSPSKLDPGFDSWTMTIDHGGRHTMLFASVFEASSKGRQLGIPFSPATPRILTPRLLASAAHRTQALKPS